MISLRVFNDSDVARDRFAHGLRIGRKWILWFHDLIIFPTVFYRSATLPGWAVGSFQGGHPSIKCMLLCRLASWWFSLGFFIKRWSWFHDLMISLRVFDRFAGGGPCRPGRSPSLPHLMIYHWVFHHIARVGSLRTHWGARESPWRSRFANGDRIGILDASVGSPERQCGTSPMSDPSGCHRWFP